MFCWCVEYLRNIFRFDWYLKCSWRHVYVPHPICAQDHFSPENNVSFSIKIWFISSISDLAYNLVVDEEYEKEQEENPESQVQLLKQVFRQNFHFGVEVCSPFSNLCLPAQKLKPPLFLTTHVTTLFFCRKFCPKHLRACGKFCNETRRASV